MVYDVVNALFYGSLAAFAVGLAGLVVLAAVGGALKGARSALADDWPEDGSIAELFVKVPAYAMAAGLCGVFVFGTLAAAIK